MKTKTSPVVSPSKSSNSNRRKKKSRHPHLQYLYQDSAEFSSNSTTFIDYENSTYLTPGSRLLTYDFVVRSLRRRLWKAFREDDAATAARAYHATLPDFVCWLEEEQQENHNRGRGGVDSFHVPVKSRSRSTSPAPSNSFSPTRRYPRRYSWDQVSRNSKQDHRSVRRGRRPRSLRVSEHEEKYDDDRCHNFSTDFHYETMKHVQQQRMETEAMIGGPSISILQ